MARAHLTRPGGLAGLRVGLHLEGEARLLETRICPREIKGSVEETAVRVCTKAEISPGRGVECSGAPPLPFRRCRWRAGGSTRPRVHVTSPRDPREIGHQNNNILNKTMLARAAPPVTVSASCRRTPSGAAT